MSKRILVVTPLQEEYDDLCRNLSALGLKLEMNSSWQVDLVTPLAKRVLPCHN